MKKASSFKHHETATIRKYKKDRKRKYERKKLMRKIYSNYVVITDNKGKRHAFYNFHELIKYIDSFKMSFLPDGFSYTIHEE